MFNYSIPYYSSILKFLFYTKLFFKSYTYLSNYTLKLLFIIYYYSGEHMYYYIDLVRGVYIFYTPL